MASMYVIGMAITYSALGVVAAKSGGLFGAALQSPVVLIALAAIMIALSLSMFGLYEFKLPESVNRLANSSTQSTSGVFGAFVMGLTMGIVAAPCIGPFVLGIARTRGHQRQRRLWLHAFLRPRARFGIALPDTRHIFGRDQSDCRAQGFGW